MTPTLHGLQTSPWTTAACFALDHAGVEYRFVEHTPLLGEGKLRRLSRSEKPSVPLLVGPDGPVMGSRAIARWADGQSRAQLFPVALQPEIDLWADRSDRILEAARILLFERLRHDPAAQRESVPGFVPGPLRGLMRFAAKQGIAFIAKKHAVPAGGSESSRVSLLAALEELQAAVRSAGERTSLLATFTFADIAMAAALNGFSPAPLEPRTQGMGPAFRACWTRAEIVARFPELYAWRDRIYGSYRLAGR